VNNLYGIQYLCGKREPHTGIPFDGIAGYPEGTWGRGFHRKQLQRILESAWLGSHKFFYPVSDCELPRMIYTDECQPGNNILERLADFYPDNSTLLANDVQIYLDSAQNWCFPFVANTFLVEAGREGALTEDEQAFLGQWIDRTFSGGYGAELAPLLTEYDQLTNTRKVEQMDFDAFSQTAWGDEAAGRIHRYEEMFAVVNRIWKSLPEEEQDAFFQMIGMKVHAAYYTNLMYYYADRSNLCMAQGKKKAARKYTDLCREFDHARRNMLHYYNHVMSGGKWNGILTPEDFPPPRTAMHPAFMPPVGAKGDASAGEVAGKDPAEETRFASAASAAGPVISLWNEGSEIVFTRPAVKWLEIGNNSGRPLNCRISGPDWIRFTESGLSETEIAVEYEERILFEADREKMDDGLGYEKDGGVIRRISDEIVVTEGEEKILCRIPVSALVWREEDVAAEGAGSQESPRYGNRVCAEDDGRICVEEQSAALSEGWKRIENLGRDSSALLE